MTVPTLKVAMPAFAYVVTVHITKVTMAPSLIQVLPFGIMLEVGSAIEKAGHALDVALIR